jgi:hypothetical protein
MQSRFRSAPRHAGELGCDPAESNLLLRNECPWSLRPPYEGQREKHGHNGSSTKGAFRALVALRVKGLHERNDRNRFKKSQLPLTHGRQDLPSFKRPPDANKPSVDGRAPHFGARPSDTRSANSWPQLKYVMKEEWKARARDSALTKTGHTCSSEHRPLLHGVI